MPIPCVLLNFTTDKQKRGQSTLMNSEASASPQKIKTKTTTLTSTVLADEPDSNQLSLPAPSTIDTMDPHMHGEVTCLRRIELRPLSIISTPTSPTTLPRTAARRSHYPLPSPPGFLYPAPIVPAAAHAEAHAVAQNNNQNQYQKQNINALDNTNAAQHTGAPRYILGRMDYSIAYLAPGLKILLLVVIAVMTCAVLWTMIVWLVNFPPRSWGWVVKWQEQSKKREKQKQKKTWDWKKDDGQRQGQKRDTSKMEEIEMQHGSAMTTAIDMRFSIGSSTPSRPRSRLVSPENPYLAPAAPAFGLTRRTSSEWLHARAAFFNSTQSNPASPRSPSTTSSASSSSMSLSATDLAAMEAGTAPLTGFAKHSKTDSEESILLKWVEEGLGMVDGAVERVVERVVRWTDDGGEEPLLLPVVERGRVT